VGLGQCIHYQEADVVTVADIVVPWIAQADDEHLWIGYVYSEQLCHD
jgi:hypothetical protein